LLSEAITAVLARESIERAAEKAGLTDSDLRDSLGSFEGEIESETDEARKTFTAVYQRLRLAQRSARRLAFLLGPLLAVVALVVTLSLQAAQYWQSLALFAGGLFVGWLLGFLTAGSSVLLFDELSSTRLYLSDALQSAAALRVNRQIGDSLEASYSLKLYFVTTRGLAESYDHALDTTPEALVTRLRSLMRQMPTGAIGIAGPRGAGKTTLIRAFCFGRHRDSSKLPVFVSAPVDYEARDFILHLYGSLCRAIVGRTDTFGPKLRARRAERFRQVAILEIVGLIALAGAAMIVLGPHFEHTLHLSSWRISGVAIVAATIFTMIYLLPQLGSLSSFRTEGAATGMSPGIISEARERLERIRYLEEISSTWGAGLQASAASIQIQKGRTINEQEATLPELVEEFREFAATVAHRGKESGVVFGIDELDKIYSIEDAQRFMNDIKGIFGIPKCFFLVSVSEDALANFDRRGLPIRDAFDSSLDEIVVVRQLMLSETRRLLQARVIGVGEAFIALCHVLAGGLARDVIRVARQLTGMKSESREVLLSSAVRELCDSDFDAKRRATITAAAAHATKADVGPVLEWLNGAPFPSTLEGVLVARQTAPKMAATWSTAGNAAHEALGYLAEEFVAYSYFVATVKEIFMPLTEDALRSALTESSSVFDLLACSKQELAVHPALSRRATTCVRERWGLAVPAAD
jgi:hypothetical protein